MTEAMQWLNLLLVPVVGLQIKIVADIAGLVAVQREHARRLNNLERKPA